MSLPQLNGVNGECPEETLKNSPVLQSVSVYLFTLFSSLGGSTIRKF